MIKIENVVLPSIQQWTAVIRGMRNPMNSWDKSDSGMGCERTRHGFIRGARMCNCCEASNDSHYICDGMQEFLVGKGDLNLMKNLVASGSDHAKFMRMITVYADITAPLYWWKEYDTYKVGTVANSCSTMHKIAAKRFEREDFSIEHLENCDEQHWMVCMDNIISALNVAREKYLETKDKKYWWQMIQLLPSSYNQRRTVELNYEVLRNMCRKGRRLDHKLDEWREFCKWMIETLPGFKEVIGV